MKPNQSSSPLPSRPLSPIPPGSNPIGDGSPPTSSAPKITSPTQLTTKPNAKASRKPNRTNTHNKSRYSLPRPQSRLLLIVVPILLILLGLSLAAVGFHQIRLSFNPQTSPTSSTKPIELEYWGLWESPSAMEQIINQFQASNPDIIITYKPQSSTDYRQRLQSALERGQGPDLFRIHSSWGPMLLNSLEIVPDSVIPTSDFTKLFYPVVANTLKTSQGYIAIPLQIDGLALYYNRKLFSVNGQTPPTNWEDLQTIAQKLTLTREDGSLQRSGLALGTINNVRYWPDIIALLILQNGGNVARPTQFYQQQGQAYCPGCEALSYYMQFANARHIWDSTMPDSVYAFAIEKSAMVFGPAAIASEIHKYNPSLNFAVAPVPQFPGNTLNWATYWAEGVSARSSSAKKQAAWRFLSYLIQKETLRQFYTLSTNSGQVLGEPFPRQDMAEQLLGDPHTGAFISQAPTYHAWFMAGETGDNGLNEALIDQYRALFNLFSENKAPDETELATIEADIAQTLQKYGLSSEPSF